MRPFFESRPGWAVLLLLGCAKVNVTPLGATADGRRQFEIICNKQAASDGSCHERAVAACGGSYETQTLSNTGPHSLSYNGQVYVAAGDQILLVACNHRGVSVRTRSPDRI
jgi:hypothetical protein